MSEQQRKAVVDEAMTWLRTPWRHMQRVKGVGVDCAQFPAAVYEAAGIIPHVEPVYPRQWALHRDEELFVEWALKYGREITVDQVKPGDLGIWKYGRTYSHAAIFVAPDQVIHAYVDIGVTLDEPSRHEELRTRPARYFTMWAD
jgi:cell wall-associated NlpC family hydrolase